MTRRKRMMPEEKEEGEEGKGGIRREEDDVEEEARLDAWGMLRRANKYGVREGHWGHGKEGQEQKEKWSLRRRRAGGQR